jgi:hypothetical protein
LLDSADSSGSRDSFGGTGFDNDSADSGDTMAYGVARFGSQDSSDSGDTSAFQNTETSESGDSADSGDSAEAGDTGMPGETAVNTTVQPDMPPAPGGAAEGLEIPNTENFVRTWIENGEGISQAMLRLGVPIEQITQALDSVEVVIGSQVNTLRNILIDASEAKGNQIGMNIQQDSDGIIRSVEFYSVANPDHVLTGSEMAELAHFDALSVADADRQIHMLEDQLDHMEPGIELYYSPLVIRIAEEDGPVQVRHITDGQHYYELTPDFLSALGVDFTKYDKSKKEFFHEVPGAPLTRRLFREIAAKESLPPIPR